MLARTRNFGVFKQILPSSSQIASKRFSTTTIPLTSKLFDTNEETLLTINPNENNPNCIHTNISTFKYSTGVDALKVSMNGKLEMILLPFQGHQIWSLAYYRLLNGSFDYYPVSMQSMFKEPNQIDVNQTWDYLRTYGGFYIHCGVLSMGAPSAQDDHPLHGELPNAKFQKSWIEYDSVMNKLRLYGSYENQKAFNYNYVFTSCHEISLANNNTGINDLLSTNITVDNNFHTPLDIMYMSHINFKPELNGELLNTSNNVKIRDVIPAHINPSKEYIQFLPKLVENPQLHTKLDSTMMNLLNTEIVMSYTDFEELEIDNENWAASMQYLDDSNENYNESGSYVTLHKSSQFPISCRWLVKDSGICALGLSLPTTSSPEGKTKCRELNEYQTIDPFNSYQFNTKYGYLKKLDSLDLKSQIEKINQNMHAKEI